MTNKKAERGRPEKEPGDRRDRKLEIRLTASEKQKLQDAARGQSVSEWARSVLINESNR